MGHDDMDTAHERFDSLFIAYEPDVRSYCARRLGRAVVDDAVNDTFAVAWRKIDLAPPDSVALPWLYAIAYRVIQHAWRSDGRESRRRQRVAAAAVAPPSDVGESYAETEQRRRVLEAAARLDEADQEILRLTLWEELTPTAAAAALEITPEAARQRARRARTRLAAEFNRLDGVDAGWTRPPVRAQEGSQS